MFNNFVTLFCLYLVQETMSGKFLMGFASGVYVGTIYDFTNIVKYLEIQGNKKLEDIKKFHKSNLKNAFRDENDKNPKELGRPSIDLFKFPEETVQDSKETSWLFWFRR
jgi:hypothetical protein